MKGGRSSELLASQQTSALSVGNCGFMTEKITSSSVCVRSSGLCAHHGLISVEVSVSTDDLSVKYYNNARHIH